MAFDISTAKPVEEKAGFDLGTAKPADEGDQYDTSEYAPPKTTPAESPAAVRAASFGRGLKDPITGGAQLLTRALPSSVVEAGNKLNNWLSKYGLVTELPKGGLEEQIRTEEAQLQARREAAGLEGTDWSRLAGNVASPANLAIAARAPQAATLAGRMGVGAGQGALSGALTPTSGEGDFATEKVKQMALGSIVGGAVPALAGAAARVIRPETSPQVKELLGAGVPLTPGQILGGGYRGLEQKVAKLPLVGDIVKSAEDRGIREFNKTVINDALSPIGEKLPKNMEVGHDAIAWAAERIGDRYEKLLPKLKGQIDRPLTRQLGAIRHLGQNLPPEKATQLNKIIDNEVIGRFTQAGLATGRTLKDIESKLGKMSVDMRRSSDYDTQTLGNAVREVQSSLRKMLERHNPDYKGELQAVNKAYMRFQRPETAAGRMAAEEGVFTPAQLRSAARQLDPSKGKKAFARGKAQYQKLAEAGEAVLPRKLTGGGTEGRAGAAALALGGASHVVNPLFAAGLGAAGAYTPIGQRLAQAALTKRPQSAYRLAEAVRRGAAPGVAGAVPLAESAVPVEEERP